MPPPKPTDDESLVSPIQIIIVIAVCALAAIVQGSLGIGLGLVASVPLLTIDPAFGPGPLLFAGQVVGTRHVISEWEHLPRRSLGLCVIGLVPGLLIGLAVLEAMSRSALSIMIGVSLVLASAALLAGARVSSNTPVGVAAGGLAAFCSITASLPGPPLVMAFSHLNPNQFRALVASTMTIIAVGMLGLLVARDRFGTHELGLLAWMMPGMVLGLILSRWTRPLLDGRSFFRTIVLVISLLAGLLLIIRQL